MSRWHDRRIFLKTLLGFYNRASWDGINVSFVISTGRTGTQFLERYFRIFGDGIDSRHEPNPDQLKNGMRFARGQITLTEARDTLRRDRKWICADILQKKKSTYIECNNNLFSLIPAIRGIWPEAKIVHVVRDGRDFVRSVMNRDHYTSKDKIYFKKDLRLKAADFPDDPYCQTWDILTPFQKCAWEWQKKDAVICRDIQGDPHAITVKYKEMFDAKSGWEGLRTIVRFLGLENDDERILAKTREFVGKKFNENKSVSFPHWRQWEQRQMEQFFNIAGGQMAYHGYLSEEPVKV